MKQSLLSRLLVVCCILAYLIPNQAHATAAAAAAAAAATTAAKGSLLPKADELLKKPFTIGKKFDVCVLCQNGYIARLPEGATKGTKQSLRDLPNGVYNFLLPKSIFVDQTHSIQRQNGNYLLVVVTKKAPNEYTDFNIPRLGISENHKQELKLLFAGGEQASNDEFVANVARDAALQYRSLQHQQQLRQQQQQQQLQLIQLQLQLQLQQLEQQLTRQQQQLAQQSFFPHMMGLSPSPSSTAVTPSSVSTLATGSPPNQLRLPPQAGQAATGQSVTAAAAAAAAVHKKGTSKRKRPPTRSANVKAEHRKVQARQRKKHRKSKSELETTAADAWQQTQPQTPSTFGPLESDFKQAQMRIAHIIQYLPTSSDQIRRLRLSKKHKAAFDSSPALQDTIATPQVTEVSSGKVRKKQQEQLRRVTYNNQLLKTVKTLNHALSDAIGLRQQAKFRSATSAVKEFFNCHLRSICQMSEVAKDLSPGVQKKYDIQINNQDLQNAQGLLPSAG